MNFINNAISYSRTLSPAQQAYLIAGIGLSLQYGLNFLAFYELLPDVLGQSLNGATKNSTYLIPGFLAIAGALWFEGSSGPKRIFKAYTNIPMNPLWWIFAATLLIPILYIALYCNDLLYGRSFDNHMYTLTTWEDIKRYAPMFTQVAISDELLWIGFIYPRLLAAGYSPLKSSLVIGILWGLDYIPFLFTHFFIATGLNAPNLLLGWLSLTPVYIWLYHKTRSAILIVFFNVCMQFIFTAIPVLPQDTAGSNTAVAMTNLICLIVGFALWYFWPKGKPYDIGFIQKP